MEKRHLILLFIGAVVIAAVLMMVFGGHHDILHDQQGATQPQSAPSNTLPPLAQPPATQAQPAVPKISGDYADDWQTKCGPITDAKAQEKCTEALDIAYGRKAGVAVPK